MSRADPAPEPYMKYSGGRRRTLGNEAIFFLASFLFLFKMKGPNKAKKTKGNQWHFEALLFCRTVFFSFDKITTLISALSSVCQNLHINCQNINSIGGVSNFPNS